MMAGRRWSIGRSAHCPLRKFDLLLRLLSERGVHIFSASPCAVVMEIAEAVCFVLAVAISAPGVVGRAPLWRPPCLNRATSACSAIDAVSRFFSGGGFCGRIDVRLPLPPFGAARPLRRRTNRTRGSTRQDGMVAVDGWGRLEGMRAVTAG